MYIVYNIYFCVQKFASRVSQQKQWCNMLQRLPSCSKAWCQLSKSPFWLPFFYLHIWCKCIHPAFVFMLTFMHSSQSLEPPACSGCLHIMFTPHLTPGLLWFTKLLCNLIFSVRAWSPDQVFQHCGIWWSIIISFLSLLK